MHRLALLLPLLAASVASAQTTTPPLLRIPYLSAPPNVAESVWLNYRGSTFYDSTFNCPRYTPDGHNFDSCLSTTAQVETARQSAVSEAGTSATNALNSAMATESLARIAGDNANAATASALTSRVASLESTATTSAALNAAIAAEASARQAGDTASLAAVTSARNDATSALALESAARQSADAAASTALANEATARSNGDAAVSTSVTALTNRVTSVEANYMTIAAANNAIATMQASINSNAGGINSLNTRVSALETTATALQSTDTALASRVTTLETTVATTASVTALTSRVSALETNSATKAELTSAIAGLQKRACANFTVASGFSVPLAGVSTIINVPLTGVPVGTSCDAGAPTRMPLGARPDPIVTTTGTVNMAFVSNGGLLSVAIAVPSGTYRVCCDM